MNENLKDELRGVDQSRAEETANILLERHGLVEFVKRWNNGDPESTLIANLNHLKEAFDCAFCGLDERINVYTPDFEADFKFRFCVEVCMDCVLLPVIEASFAKGLQRVVTRWARQTIRSWELRSQSAAPFRSEAEWLEWLVEAQFRRIASRPVYDGAESRKRLAEEPPQLVLCSPEGGSLFPAAAEKALAAYALLENIELAREQCWLTKLALH